MIHNFRQWLTKKWHKVMENRVLYQWQKGNYLKVAKLVNKVEKYQAVTFNEYPLIYMMINDGKSEGIEKFLRNINYKQVIIQDDNNPMKATPIVYAFLEGNEEIIEVLEKHGANLRFPNSQQQNALHLAAIYQREESFNKGLTMGIDINACDLYGNTPFHYACRTGALSLVKNCLVGNPKKVMNKIYQYPIHMAIESGSLQCVMLLKKDIDQLYPDFHPIHSAVRSSKSEVVDYLLKLKPACINFTDYNGLTPLHHAVLVQDMEIFDLLMSRKDVTIDKTDKYNNTPLHLAFLDDNLEMCRKLVERNANLEVVNDDHMRPVDYGMSSTNVKIHSFLKSIAHKSSVIKQWSQPRY